MQKYFFQILPPFFQLPLHHLRYPNPKYLKSVFFLIFSDSHVLDIGDYVPAKKKRRFFSKFAISLSPPRVTKDSHVFDFRDYETYQVFEIHKF